MPTPKLPDALARSLSRIQGDATGRLSGLARFLMLVLVTLVSALTALLLDYTVGQTASLATFVMLVAATALYWEFHLAFAFLGVSGVLLMNILDLSALASETKLDVIIFLMGMMIIVGVLKDLGLFSWIITRILSMESLSARKFTLAACLSGAVMSCLVDEMASIVFAAALIFQVVDALDIKPLPFIMMAVMSVNIGSAGTMLGNPVTILIGQNAQPPLAFNDFMVWSFPLMAAEFVAVMIVMFTVFRAQIREMDEKMAERRAAGLSLAPMVRVPHRRGLMLLGTLLVVLIAHKAIENALGLQPNTALITAPLLISGALLVWRREHIHRYLEYDVDWGIIMFLMMLFMIAGALERTGTTTRIAHTFASVFGNSQEVLIPAVLGVSTLGSAFVENIVFVSAFMPVVNTLEQTPLLWALLHGCCLGGNITMVGSTSNIVAVGMMEKRYWTKINFWVWLRTGLLVGFVSCLVAWIGIAFLAPRMPSHAQRVEAHARAVRGVVTRVEAREARMSGEASGQK